MQNSAFKVVLSVKKTPNWLFSARPKRTLRVDRFSPNLYSFNGAHAIEEEKRMSKETPQEYISRILGHLEGQDPVKVQSTTAKKLERLVKGATASKLRERPAPDKWSVIEILAHLADTEIVGGYRMRMILGSPGTPIQAFDQDAWVVTGHYHKRDARKSIEQFRALREANLALLKSLSPDQWKHHGIHSERGEETITHITRMFAGHDLNHIRQIERILSPKKG
jgi:hypothetical protein